ncbi:hypothetical protein [Candidatus Protochlamydia phocaeensis]|uniref:hypothetical protein n=1 Tax=Candidatus Protochlamydia phocaeensis TaxID=1414722 RepID=UPI000837F338|nr:hypothetical protein [Candidatus Protochlamydia phocaeensis]
MNEDFWADLHEGDIHVRDNLQFELKSEFFINPTAKQNVYKQEFFLFIPNSLNINKQTYSKEQFYLDQTNLFRYKTPQISLKDLINPSYHPSPLIRLQHFLSANDPLTQLPVVFDELKLFGNVFKAALRERMLQIELVFKDASINELQNAPQAISELCTDVTAMCELFRRIRSQITTNHSHALKRHFRYVDEFISDTIDTYFLALLQQLRHLEHRHYISSEKQLCQIILREKLYRKRNYLGPKTLRGHIFSNESILYRRGLLNQFMREALLLKSYRYSLEEKHRNILGATAAGIAMFIYMVLFAWKASDFVINSFPFIFFAVVFYILKDRIKEGLKNIYFRQAYRWFPDYSTEIQSPKGYKVGYLKESLAFIDPSQLPLGFLKIRNYHFHEELQALNRHETIIQYKREVTLFQHRHISEERRRELTTIFRLNIQYFLKKASNALQPHLDLDTYTQEINERLLPKVYHLNMIIRNTYLASDSTVKIEIKKFRVVMDKIGIKRVEQIKSP